MSRVHRLELAFLLALLLASAYRLRAQDLPDVAQGLQPYVAYHGGKLDQISTLNGGLSLRIPLVSYPQKGSSLTLSYSVVFNSFGFQDIGVCATAGPSDPIPLHSSCTNNIQLIPTGVTRTPFLGPRLVTDQQLQAGGISALESVDYQASLDARFYVIGPDNAEHPLAPASGGYRSIDEAGFLFTPSLPPAWSNGNIGVAEDAYGGDAARLMSAADGTITDSKGIVYTSGSIADPDGNTILLAPPVSNQIYSGLPATDSAGRSILAPVAAPDTSGCPTLPNAPFQPLSSAYTWTVPGPGGTEKYLFCYASVNIYTHFSLGAPETPNSSNSQYIRTVSMLQSIVLPNRTFWGFIYDSNDPGSSPAPTASNQNSGLGQLVTLIYPTGGSVNYTYGVYEGFCDAARPNGTNPYGATIIAYPPQVLMRTMKDAQGNTLGTWTYTAPGAAGYTGSILSPAGDLTVTHFQLDPNAPCSGIDAGQDVYSGPSFSGPLLRKTVKSYSFPNLFGLPYASAARETKTVTTLEDGSTFSVQKSYAPDIAFSYIQCDTNGITCNSTVPSTASAGFSNPLGGPILIKYGYDGSVLKQETTTYQWQANSAYLGANFLDAPASTSVLDGGGATQSQTAFSYDESAYSAGGIRGHITTSSPYLNVASEPAPVMHTGWYGPGQDGSGSESYSIDANGNKTSYQYSQCNGSLRSDTFNALSQHTSGSYDCGPGLLTSYTDANSQTTQINWDVMGRLHQITYPKVPIAGNQTGNPQTTFDYDDPNNTVKRTIAAAPNPDQVTQVVFDGFGRESHRYTSDSPGPITIDTTYDPDGRVYTVSNPYRSATDPTGLTTTTYDALNRKLTQQQPDGTSLTWSYSGPSTDSWDEAQTHYRHTTDALGRLTQVLELGTPAQATNFETDYFYDALNNLLCVEQHGGVSGTGCAADPLNDSRSAWRVRRFAYDSLSRLVASRNPETGSGQNCPGVPAIAGGYGICYGYDPNGNPLSKTDANGMTINYHYDALNRLLSKTAPDIDAPPGGVSTSGLGYDQGPNGIGRLTSQFRDGVAGETYNYDAMGRVGGTTWVDYESPGHPSRSGMQVQYDLAGNPSQLTYPDGRVVSQSWDGAGRLASVADGQFGAGGKPYFSAPPGGSQYWPSGALANVQLGSNITESFSLNNRLQPVHAMASSSLLAANPSGGNLLDRQSFYTPTGALYCPSAAASNNGNIYAIVDNLQAGATQTFAYDGLNRLTCGRRSDNAYNHTYEPDPWGNTRVHDQNPKQGDMGETIDAATNRMFIHGGYLSYDPAGNLNGVPIPTGGYHSFSYTAEGYLRCLDNCQLGSYLVDAIGQRSFAQHNQTWNEYVYLNGQPMADVDPRGIWTDYIYANGQKIARVSPASDVLHLTGATAANTGSVSSGVALSGLNGITLQQGDTLRLSQFTAAENGIQGGVWLGFTNGDYSTSGAHGWIRDTDGYPANLDGVTGQWHQRTIDLSTFAGLGVNQFLALNERTGSVGQFDLYFGDISLQRADGTVIPVWIGSPNANWLSATVFGPGQATAQVDPAPPPGVDSTLVGTHFYLDDHLGTTQMEVSGGGCPLWQGQFTPYGQEIINGGTMNALGPQPADGTSTRFKFTGKERDAETGNDYFGARYYASTMGRFLSPDWAAKAQPVPYANLENPQTLNLYAYVGNNPLSRTDPTGHYVCSGSKEECAQIQDGLNLAKAAQAKLGADSKEGKAIGAVLKFYGAAGEKNGVGVSFGNLAKGTLGETTAGANGSVNIKFDLGQINSFARGSMPGTSLTERAGTEVHEGRHGVDDRADGHGPENRHEEMQTERNAYRTQSYFYEGLGVETPTGLWSPSWSPANAERNRNAAVQAGAERSTNAACAQGCQP